MYVENEMGPVAYESMRRYACLKKEAIDLDVVEQ
jgi:hypothetical protein